jgi:ferric-dicitrate binding protein FerR (iron transport regulator)
MNIPTKVIREFQYLLIKSLEHAITDAEIDRIHEIFLEWPQIISLYHEYISLNLALRQSAVFSLAHGADDSFHDLLTELAEQEKTAPSVEKPVQPLPLPTKTVSPSTLQAARPTRTWPLLAAVCTLLLLALIVPVHVQHWLAPREAAIVTGAEVATVTDMLDAKVEGPVLTPLVSRLTDKSGPIVLTAGVMKITFDCGVKVVIEGPARFQVESAKRISLHKGNLYAQVSESGRGFRVDTPSSQIVDLGTEFGIRVPEDQTTSIVYMYSGRATVSSLKPDRAGDREVLLTQGQAREVTAAGDISRIDMKEAAFIRDFNSKTKTDWRGEWLTVVPLPTHDTDQASGIRADKAYTHLLDVGSSGTAVVNGVPFSPVDFNKPYTDVVLRNDALQFTLTRIGANSFRPFLNERQVENADGGMQALLSDFIFLSNAGVPGHYVLTLTGLTPGQKYSLRLYYCADQRELMGQIPLIFNGEGHDKTILVDEQARGAHYVRYDYTAGSEEVNVTFRAGKDDRSWHLYGLSNEVIDVGH